MKKDPRVYLAQILERIDRIIQYTAEGKEAFFADPLIQDAVIRNFEIIGEAAKRIPEEYRKKHSSIPWRGLSGVFKTMAAAVKISATIAGKIAAVISLILVRPVPYPPLRLQVASKSTFIVSGSITTPYSRCAVSRLT